jgi:hypothetical protein
MATGKFLMGLMVAVLVGATLFSPLASSVNDNTGTVTVTNETATATVGAYEQLDGYQIDDSTDVVYYDNNEDGTFESATQGTDYELATDNGSIKVLSGGAIDDGAPIKTTYEYRATDDSTTTVAGLVPLLAALLLLVFLANGIMTKL